MPNESALNDLLLSPLHHETFLDYSFDRSVESNMTIVTSSEGPPLYGLVIRCLSIYALLLVIVGTLGNTLTIIVLCRPNLRRFVTMRYLIAVSVFDIVSLYGWNLNNFYKFTISTNGSNIEQLSLVHCRIVSFVTFVGLQLSSWCLTVVSIGKCSRRRLSPLENQVWVYPSRLIISNTRTTVESHANASLRTDHRVISIHVWSRTSNFLSHKSMSCHYIDEFPFRRIRSRTYIVLTPEFVIDEIGKWERKSQHEALLTSVINIQIFWCVECDLSCHRWFLNEGEQKKKLARLGHWTHGCVTEQSHLSVCHLSS